MVAISTNSVSLTGAVVVIWRRGHSCSISTMVHEAGKIIFHQFYHVVFEMVPCEKSGVLKRKSLFYSVSTYVKHWVLQEMTASTNLALRGMEPAAPTSGKDKLKHYNTFEGLFAAPQHLELDSCSGSLSPP